MIREAYEQAAAWFVEVVGRIDGTQWEAMALGEWTVRDLVGHANRAVLTVETYLGQPAETVEVARPVDYFLRAQAALADPAAVAARGREAGQALGPDPAAIVQADVTRVVALLRQTPDAARLATPVGGMQLIDYLPSRVFELTLHTLDLAEAISVTVTLPDAAAAVALRMIADLAQQPGKAAPLLLAATGRRGLPEAYSVL